MLYVPADNSSPGWDNLLAWRMSHIQAPHSWNLSGFPASCLSVLFSEHAIQIKTDGKLRFRSWVSTDRELEAQVDPFFFINRLQIAAVIGQSVGGR